MHSKYLIIGAGLSGLSTAYFLSKQGIDDFLVLEGRDVIGGRILTEDGIDFGGTWFQNHHSHLNQLLTELEIEKFPQFGEGKSILVYNTMAPAHYFESGGAPTAFRIAGGSKALIEKLAGHFTPKIQTGVTVSAIIDTGKHIRVEAQNKAFTTDRLIVTMPPKLARGLRFSPELPEEVSDAMGKTHTWMSNAIKVGLSFKSPFWRTKGLSGTLIGQVGPVIELYDHCDFEHQHFALMGFVNEGLRDVTPEARKARILGYLETHFGKEIQQYTSYSEKDWSVDPYTSGEQLKSVYMSPQYGHPVFKDWYYGGKLLFSGTETAPQYGGYLDGAIFSAQQAVHKLCEQNDENLQNN